MSQSLATNTLALLPGINCKLQVNCSAVVLVDALRLLYSGFQEIHVLWTHRESFAQVPHTISVWQQHAESVQSAGKGCSGFPSGGRCTL